MFEETLIAAYAKLSLNFSVLSFFSLLMQMSRENSEAR